MQDKLISIIIPTYKRPDVLPRAVDSVLAQSYKNIEVIVVDDNDPTFPERAVTEKVMEKYADEPRVKYIKHPKNMNGSAARNTGFANSSGEYIMFLDDDDEFLPGKIEIQYERMESLDESWGLAYIRYEFATDEGKVLAVSAEKNQGDLLVDALSRNLYIGAGSGLIIRRSVMEDLNGFDASFIRNQDQEFLVRGLKKYKMACIDAVGIRVYDHKGGRPNIDFDDLTKQYIQTFKKDIDALSEQEQRVVYCQLALQRAKGYFLKKKDIKSAKAVLKQENIPIREAISYLFYLVNRKLRKINVGYKVKFVK